ncbi:MAG: CapA family protein [Clostridia bacterium]|nr:CapA family protein [Clostridia bacterium]
MTSISFTGDIAFSKYFKDKWKEDFLDEKVVEFLTSSNHVVANVEAPLTARTVDSDREINHLCSPKAGEWFQKISANIWTIANNHILDCGEEGMVDTISVAKKYGAMTVGAGINQKEAEKPVIIDSEGGIGIIAVTYKRGEFIRATEDSAGCVLFDEPKKIKSIIEKVKAKNRWCVVIAHGGDEFSHLPLPYIKKLYKKFLKMGADVVVGHHPHVVQNYEKVGDKAIFYSLGNFVFDTDYQRKQKHSEYGILLKLHFSKDKFEWEYLATKVNRSSQRIETTVPPEIFCEIGKKQYKLLWPLVARLFTENFVVAKTFAIPKTRNYTKKQWFNFHKEKIGLKNALCVYLGKAISYLSLWKRAPENLKNYLLK